MAGNRDEPPIGSLRAGLPFLAAPSHDADWETDLDADWDDSEPDGSVAEALGLPDRLPPIRLPDPAELAESARASLTLRQVRDLARWVGAERALAGGELSATDAGAAAAAVGLEPQRQYDLAVLNWVWELADALDLIQPCGDHVHGADDLDDGSSGTSGAIGTIGDRWAGWDDEDVLALWADALGYLTAAGVPPADRDDESPGGPNLDFEAAGVLCLIVLFMARDEGVDRTELSELVRESATEGMAAAAGTQAWIARLRSHGDPTDELLNRFAELGAVVNVDDVDGGSVRLTPLAAYTVREQLIDSGVEIPLLPPAAEMTAADLLASAHALSEEELGTEVEAWLALRTPQASAAQLLDAAASGEPSERLLAVAITTELGAAVESSWQEALPRAEVRPYAKLALATISGDASDGSAGSAEYEPEIGDIAWLITDMLASVGDALDDPDADDGEAGAVGRDELIGQFREAVPPGKEDEIFDAMWRQPHPYAHQVLTLLGRELPDKELAKNARRAAFKAANRG